MKQNNNIIFVCEHGAAKSIIAATFFNQLAKQRRLNWAAIARGTNPDAALSDQTIQGLTKDGLTPIEVTPQGLSLEDIKSAQRMISFCKLPGEFQNKIMTEQWNGIPPVSENYNQARDALLERLNHLIEEINM